MLNRTAALTTMADLRAVALTPPPNAGGMWAGVPHADLINRVRVILKACHWTTAPVVAHLSRCGMDLTASIVATQGDTTAAIGVNASNAGRRRLSWFIGTWDEEWGCGTVYDTFRSGRRYAAGFDLTTEVEEAVARWTGGVLTIPRRRSTLARTRMTGDEAAGILLAAQDTGHIPARNVMPVLAAFRDGPDLTAWGLYRAASRSIGTTTPAHQLEHLLGLYRLVVPVPAAA